jgi:putative ABC transport system permease protein
MRWWRRRSEADYAAEIRTHLDLQAEELTHEGHSEADARALARRAFGNVTIARERYFESRRLLWLEQFLQDLRYTLRQFRRAPGFTAVVVLTLAIGIALNTTVFSVVSAILLRPVPYSDPPRLVGIFRTQRGGENHEPVPAADLPTYREQSRSFADVAAYGYGAYTLSTPAMAQHLQGAWVTANTFRVLGVHPVLGRDFRAEEDVPGYDGVVMLSWSLWHTSFTGDSAVIGRIVSLNGRARTVIGVMPPGFAFPEAEKVWVPAALAPTQLTRNDMFLQPIARLAPGVSIASASEEVATIAKRLNAASSGDAYKNWGATVMPFREAVVSSQGLRVPLLLLLGAVGFVLLIACANVANLQLARAATRTREMALRTALGAGRARLARQLLTEGVVLALAGGVFGVLATLLAVRAVRAMVPVEIPSWLEFRVDPMVLAFAAGLVGLTGIVLGVVPAMHGTRVDPQRALKEGGNGSTHGVARTGVRGVLVVAEVALSLVLLVCAALTVQSFLRVERSRLGFDPDGVVTATVAFGGGHYDTTANRTAFLYRMIDSLEATPGIQRAAVVSALPVLGYGNSLGFEAEGHPVAISDAPITDVNAVVGDYFAAMRIPLLAGRTFTAREATDGTSHVAVISQAMARKFWPGESPLGRRVRRAGETPGQWVTVVGVVGDIAQNGLGESGMPRPEIFLAGGPWQVMSVVVRGSRDVADIATLVRRTVRALDRDTPVYDLHTMREVIANAESIWLPRFYGVLFGAFALAALVLAAVGMYGVIAFTVRQRTREIGIRVALGATRADVLRLVLGQSAKLSGVGLVLGLAGAIAGGRLLSGMLYGIRPTDPATLIMVPLLLGAVALAASYLPARHAARVDPTRTLRDE